MADTARSSIAAGGLAAPGIEPRSARRVNTDFSIGPSLSLELPVFDQNQAQIARARFEFDQAWKLLATLETSICQEVRSAVDHTETACRVARFYRDEILPQVRRNLDLSRASYRAGKSSILAVLDAERTYLSTRDRSAEASSAAATTVPELERVIGRPIARMLSTAGDESREDDTRSAARQITETNGADDDDPVDSHDEGR